jgi:hypothetical protein
MASQISICNKALLRVGQAPIQSINEQSTEAAYCRQFFDDARKATLRGHAWSFATKVAQLAELSEETSYRYEHVYQKPADCLRVIEVLPDGTVYPDYEKVEFEALGQTIQTDESTAWLKYVYNETDTARFDDLFVEALSYRLAADLAMPLSRDANYVGAMMNMFKQTLSEARTVDGRSGGNRVLEIGRSFVNARL